MQIQHARTGALLASVFVLVWPAVPLVAALGGCSRADNKVVLTPPFNPQTAIGELTAEWENTGEERLFDGEKKLDSPASRFRYRVDALNLLQDKLFVRLGNFHLINKTGAEIAGDGARLECVLGSGKTQGVLSGDIWVAARAAGDIHGFGISHFAVPLSSRGRALYREWALQARRGDAASVDAEIERYAEAPACPRR